MVADKYRHVDLRGSQASCSTQNGGCQVQWRELLPTSPPQKKHKKSTKHQPLAPTQASTLTYHTQRILKLGMNVEKLELEAHFKSLQVQITMRVKEEPFPFLARAPIQPSEGDGWEWWLGGKVAGGVCTLSLQSAAFFPGRSQLKVCWHVSGIPCACT